MATRSVQIQLPPTAAVGDTLQLMTQVGMTESVITSIGGPTLMVDVPVPADCKFSTLTLAFCRVLRDGAEIAVATAAATPSRKLSFERKKKEPPPF